MKKFQIILYLLFTLHIQAQNPGDLDVNFLQTGIANIDYSSLANDFSATAIQADGKIVVAGQANGHPLIGRMLANGNWDMSFGIGGIWIDVQSPLSSFNDVAIAPNGNIYATGYEYLNTVNDYAIVICLLSNGYGDATFGTGGYVKKDLKLGRDFGKSILIQPDGKILVGGGAAYTSPSTGIVTLSKFVFRLNSDGTDDTSFGAGTGYVTPQFGNGFVSDMAIYNGTIALSFASRPYLYYYSSIEVISLLDMSDGLEVNNATCNYYAGSGSQGLTRLAFASDGTLWAAISYSPNVFTFPETDFYKINTNISNGTFNIFAYTYYFNEATAILPNQGGFFVAGPLTSGGQSDVINFDSNGLLDFSFATQGIFQTDGVYNANIRDMKFTPNGKLVAVGISPSIYHSNTQSIEDDGFAMVLHTQNSVAIESTMPTPSFQITPNPNKGAFQIVWQTLASDAKLSIWDINGRNHYSAHFSKYTKDAHLDINLPKGLYFVKMETEKGDFTQKIIFE